jgi:hypothetical protein
MSKSKFQKYLAPGKSGRSMNNSAIIAPIAHISVKIFKNRNQSKRRKETKMNRRDKSSPRLKCKIKTNPSSSNTHDPPNQPIIIANLFHTWILLGLTRNTRMKSAQHKRRHNLGTVRKTRAMVGN